MLLFLGCRLSTCVISVILIYTFLNSDCMSLFPVAQECSCFVACMSLIHFQILTLSLSTMLFVRKYVFLSLFEQVTYFRYSGQVNFIFCYLRISGVINFPISEGMLSFILPLITQYSSSKCIGRYRAIQVLVAHFFAKCQFLYVYLSALFPLVHHFHSL